MKNSYYITFSFLFFTFLISFLKQYYIVALINLIASYMYYFLIKNPSIQIRYIDWILTTPLLLYELSNILNIKNKTIQIIIQICNLLMFYFGWLGEIQPKKRFLFCFLGFIPLVIIFSIYYSFLTDFQTTFYYYYFLIIWSMYGIVYLKKKNRAVYYNVLDILSKSIFGFIYLYWVGKVE